MNDLRLIREIQILYDKKVYLWGAGIIGRECVDFLEGSGIDIVGICDNNKQLQGTYIGAYLIFSEEEIKSRMIDFDHSIIVITSNHLEQIHQQLLEMGVDPDKIFSKFALYYSILKNIDHSLIPSSYREAFKDKYRRWKYINHRRADHRFSFKYYAYNWEKMIQSNPIVIYQPGKVASATMLNSIKAYGRNVVATHALAFRDEFMDTEMKSMYLDLLDSAKKKNKIRLISGVREPIKRDISYLFEHICLPFVELYDEFDSDLVENIEDCLIRYFVERKKEFKGMSPTLIHHMIRVNGGLFQWFERELSEVYQINILEYPFDKEKGYAIIKKGNVELLIYKLEKLNSLENVIGEFLGIDDFRLMNTNLSSDKDYRYAYDQVMDMLQLPECYIDMYYKDNEYMDHFYTEKEKDDLLIQWKRKNGY